MSRSLFAVVGALVTWMSISDGTAYHWGLGPRPKTEHRPITPFWRVVTFIIGLLWLSVGVFGWGLH